MAGAFRLDGHMPDYSPVCCASISSSTASGAMSFFTSSNSGSFSGRSSLSAIAVTSEVSVVSSCSVSSEICRSRSACRPGRRSDFG
jgi:hypothetical protein